MARAPIQSITVENVLSTAAGLGGAAVLGSEKASFAPLHSSSRALPQQGGSSEAESGASSASASVRDWQQASPAAVRGQQLPVLPELPGEAGPSSGAPEWGELRQPAQAHSMSPGEDPTGRAPER